MYIASSSTSVKFHSFPEGYLVYNYQPGSKVEGPVRSISWSKDGSWVSVVPQSGLPEIISVRNQLKFLHTITDIEDPSCTAFQNTTKKFIAFGSKNGQVQIYDVKQKKIKSRFPPASSMISHIEFTARDTHVVAGCVSGEVLLYSNLTNALSTTLKIPRSDSVSALRTNPMKRNIIMGGSNEGMVVVWDSNINKHKFFVEAHKAPITGVAFCPNNSDLIITTGADRQFSCYDIISNKCIASVPVSNNMTAVDFSHDGTHFVLASQEGNISLYDSRRILEPVLVFEAHNSTVKNIAFQKQEMVNSNSSLLEDFGDSEQHVKNNEEDVALNVSFGNLLSNSLEYGDVPEKVSESPNTVDSFMANLGLGDGLASRYDQSITEEGDNLVENNSYNKEQTEDSIAEPERLSLYRRRSLSTKQVSTSTPTCPQIVVSKLEAVVSPIANNLTDNKNNNEELAPVPLDHMKKMVEETVRKELSDKFESFAKDMKYQFSNANAQMRRMNLNLMMAMMKDFIKMENRMDALREDVAMNSPLSDNYLLEENLRLKKQIALLQEQICKTDQDN
ncbi:protein NEDD1-like isoform X1 [Harmonia axyridis]|uniref:protein NEDD1-like isoform X1 n=1 Tax=Harmonia axyridis TaxID=115357 RepID=UPI001E27518D|nr:protein NEDD1-like isoform X1 [Harmonia axyridis]